MHSKLHHGTSSASRAGEHLSEARRLAASRNGEAPWSRASSVSAEAVQALVANVSKSRPPLVELAPMLLSRPWKRMTQKVRRGCLVVVTVALAASATGCSLGSKHTKAAQPTTTTLYAPPRCEADQHRVAATPVAGSAIDWNMSSFDGTTIRLHWMPMAGASRSAPAPTILMGAGWGLPGATLDTQVDTSALAAVDIATLHAAGYNVLTWDARGFGASGGTAELDSPRVEGADVRLLIDWLADRPEAELDGTGDPRVGMLGASYAGAIGIVAAAADCRVDAVVAMYTWNSLADSLFPSGVPKAPWLEVLSDAAPGQRANEHLHSASQLAAETGRVDGDDLSFFRERDLTADLHRINVPTLFVQGTVDGLVDLDQSIESYQILRDRKIPTGLVWTCGGHGACVTAARDPNYVPSRVLPWFHRYLQRDADIDVGSGFHLRSDSGDPMHAAAYPPPLGPSIVGSGSGTLKLLPDGGSGPIDPRFLRDEVAANAAIRATPAPASNAVDIPLETGDRSGVLLGHPVIELSYRGSGGAAGSAGIVFTQLVDVATGLVVDGRAAPLRLKLDGAPHTLRVSLPTLAHAFVPNASLTFQIVATTTSFAHPMFGGEVEFDKVAVTLPVAAGLKPGD